MIEVKHLDKSFGDLHILKDISTNIEKGEKVVIIGPSGSGKSTFLRCLNRLEQPSDGQIFFEGEDLTHMPDRQLYSVRQKMGMVFQHFHLFPHLTIQKNITLAPVKLKRMTQAEADAKATELLQKVGLADKANQYPDQLSGGQKQRIGIARALALEPKLIICDEAVSALDVSVQAQVLNLLQELKERLGLTYFFISHNLNVVYQVSDRVGVMYLGKMVEIAAYDQLYEKRYHPYTEALLSAIPQVDADDRTERIHLTGEVPSPSDPPSGCPFHTRCPKACDICSKEIPQLKEIEKGHFVACHLYQ